MTSEQFADLRNASRFAHTRYFTGKPCRHGHVCERRLCDGKCVECQRQKQLQIGGGVWPKHKIETVKKYNRSDKRKRQQRTYRLSDKGVQSDIQYRTSDKCRAVKKRYKQSEKGKVTTRRYEEGPAGRAHAIRNENARRARKNQQSVCLYSFADRIARFEEFGNECVYCGSKENLTEDHVVALSRGGPHDLANIVPACSQCNKKKHVHDVESWYKKQPFFLQDRWDKIANVLNKEPE